MTSDALARVIARAGTRTVEERCDLCSLPVPPQHRHLLDADATGTDNELLCVCRACSLLFVDGAASRGHYRLVPERRRRLRGVQAKDLGVPVSLAFFVRDGEGVVHAHYPSPAGATRWTVDPSAWQRVTTAVPVLLTLEPDVEALLVNGVHRPGGQTGRQGADEQWLVPIDECYRLVAVIRRGWRGLSGGTEVWTDIARFFEELDGRAGRKGAA